MRQRNGSQLPQSCAVSKWWEESASGASDVMTKGWAETLSPVWTVDLKVLYCFQTVWIFCLLSGGYSTSHPACLSEAKEMSWSTSNLFSSTGTQCFSQTAPATDSQVMNPRTEAVVNPIWWNPEVFFLSFLLFHHGRTTGWWSVSWNPKPRRVLVSVGENELSCSNSPSTR